MAVPMPNTMAALVIHSDQRKPLKTRCRGTAMSAATSVPVRKMVFKRFQRRVPVAFIPPPGPGARTLILLGLPRPWIIWIVAVSSQRAREMGPEALLVEEGEGQRRARHHQRDDGPGGRILP